MSSTIFDYALVSRTEQATMKDIRHAKKKLSADFDPNYMGKITERRRKKN